MRKQEKSDKQQFQDDNHVIADMDHLDGMRMFSFGSRETKGSHHKKESREGSIPPEKAELTKEEMKALRRAAFAFSAKIAGVAFIILFAAYFLLWIILKLM